MIYQPPSHYRHIGELEDRDPSTRWPDWLIVGGYVVLLLLLIVLAIAERT